MTRHPLEAETWIFDLDNTLYDHKYNLFDGVSSRMTQYIIERFDLNYDDAKALQKKYFHEMGTTLRGLMTHHNVPPQEFLDYVHDTDYSILPANPELNTLLARLDRRKIIFTNGSVKHAIAVLQQLGIAEHFNEIFDIANADYIPKPAAATYQRMINQFQVDPAHSIMLEDIAVNLKQPKMLGMQTVYIQTNEEWAMPDSSAPNYIDHETDNITDWLRRILTESTDA